MSTDLVARIEALPPDRRRALIEALERDGERYGVHPPTGAQARMWLLSQMRPDSAVYHVAHTFNIAGDLDVDALDAALGAVVARHEALRTVFFSPDGEPRQMVLPADAHAVRLSVDRAAADQVADRLHEEARRPFDLERGPLLRATVLRTSPEQWVLALTMHHIVCDGWSMRVLYDDLAAAYAAHRDGSPLRLPILPRYVDAARRQEASLEPPGRERLLAYWRKAIEGAPRTLDLPTDRPRAAVLGDEGDEVTFSWPAELARRVAAAARRYEATPFVVLAAACQAVLHRYTGQEDILLGCPVAGRSERDVEDLVGLFVNTLVLRSRTGPGSSFGDLLDQARATTFAALAHQQMPFHVLVDELQADRDPSTQPLFQVMLAVEEGDECRLDLAGLAVRGAQQHTGTAKFDLTLAFVTDGDRLDGRLEYRTHLFDRATMVRLAGHLRTLLEAALDDPDRPIADLPLLSAAELRTLRGRWGTFRSPTEDRRPVHRLIEERADAAPDAAAVSDDARTFTYRRLDERADRIAALLEAAGVGAEAAVGVHLPRCADLAASFLAVLKAGAVYVPLDVALPAERLRHIVADAGIEIVLAHADTAARLPPDLARIIALDAGDPAAAFPARRRQVEVHPDSAAYLIYTSGSTGRAKGVVGTHGGLRYLADAQRDLVGVRPGDRVLQFHSPGFDVSISELVTALCGGAELRIVPREALLPGDELRATLRREAITVADLPPVALAATEPAGLDCLRSLTVGGEPCAPDVATAWSGGRDFFNAYGPTETTVTATAARFGGGATVPIGNPLAGGRAYVLDARRQPVPVGVAGELYVGGAGVARGYLGDSGLTAQRFLPDPFADAGSGRRMYRTGDTVRMRADGALEFLGRSDTQVKLRGHRIELGEIEARLRAMANVRQAAVVLRTDGPAARLVAYLAGDGLNVSVVRRELERHLPGYMVPEAFVFVHELPMTLSGKLDQRALPEPSGERPDLDAAYVSPRNALEERVVAVWRDVLAVDRVGAHDNFFDVGGNSLLLAKVRSRLAEALGTDIPALELFRHPTPALLARYLAAPDEPARSERGHDRDVAYGRRALAERARRRRDGQRKPASR